ncbi:MAG: COG1361 S-layer family protein [Candidatus Diapherotrites archaeon]
MKKIILVLAVLALFAVQAWAVSLDVSSVNYDPVPVVPGKLFSVWVQVKNTSKAEAENVVFNLDLKYPFSVKDGEAKKSIGSIAADQTALVKYDVLVAGDAPGGSYEVKFQFGDNSGLDKEIKYTIDVQERAPQIEVVNSSVESASPGKDIDIALTLENTGKGKATDVTVTIGSGTQAGAVAADILPLGSPTRHVDEIEAGEMALVSFRLNVSDNADLATYTVPVSISFSDYASQNQFTAQTFIGLKVADSPDLGLVISSISPAAAAGKTSTVTFDIYNTGNGAARYLVIGLESNNAQIKDSEVFIGTLQADDFDSFKTDFTFDRNFSADNKITVKMIYRGQDNEVKEIVKELPVEVQSLSSATTGFAALSGVAVPIAAVIIVIVIAGFFLLRGRKKKSQE